MNFSGVREDRFRSPIKPSSPPKYGTSPQHGASTLKFEHVTSLDVTFNKLVFEISQRLELVAKAPKIRLETWLRKLHEPESNVAWKKNRNNYARLLLASLKLGRLDAPFHKVPDEGRLKILPPHMMYGLCKAEKGPGHGREDPPRRKQGRRSTSPSAAASLEDLLRKADVATAGKRSGRDDFTRKPGGLGARTKLSWDVDSDEDDGERANSGRRSGGRPSGTGIGGGALELEAELGACRERCKELEWKLARANTSLEHQSKELSQARDSILKLQAAKAEELKELRRAHRKQLDEMIVTFEKRRSEWAPRAVTHLAGAGSTASPVSGGFPAGSPLRSGGKAPPYADPKSKDGDFFEYLEKFQKQTEQLRHHLDPGRAATAHG